MKKQMPRWPEDLSKCSLEEVFRSESENRAWNKELRLRTTALVNSRLAKDISPDEYALSRQISKDDAAECKRRGALLVKEIRSRGVRLAPQ
jgi:hypothetical protein